MPPVLPRPIVKPWPLLWGTVVVLAVFAGRLWRISSAMGTPSYYYTDSSSHILNALWHATGVLKWSFPRVPLAGFLYAAATRMGLDVFYAAWAVNAALGLMAVWLLFDAVRRLAGPGAATVSAVLALSVPSFGRLVFSGQTEMTALAFTALSFWIACYGLFLDEPSNFWADLAAFCLLGYAASVRSDGLGLFGLAGIFLFLRWRRRPRFWPFFVGAGLVCLYVILPSLMVHGRGASTANAADQWLSFGQRFLRLPAWLLKESFPFNVFLCAGLAHFSGKRFFRPLGWFAVLVLGQAFLLWAGSWFYLFSWETERNMNTVLFLAMAPAGAAVWAAASALGRYGMLLGLLLAAGPVGWSWERAMKEVPARLSLEDHNRGLGRRLRELNAEGKLGRPESLILLEVADSGWPNVLVFSGMPERFRLLPSTETEWGKVRIWDGRGEAGVAVVSSERAEKELAEDGGSFERVDVFGDYNILRVGKAPAAPGN